MFGTDTFLSGYARSSHPYDFYSVSATSLPAPRRSRTEDPADLDGQSSACAYSRATAQPRRRRHYRQTRRCSTAPEPSAGSCPASTHRLEPVPGIEEGGRLIVSGPNVMKGYLLPDRPGPSGSARRRLVRHRRHRPRSTTTVIVTIRGRAKRFAKIAGEMVSLTAVEAHVSQRLARPRPRGCEPCPTSARASSSSS